MRKTVQSDLRPAIMRALEVTGMSAPALGKAAGVSVDIIKNIRGEKSQRPNVDFLRDMAAFFGVSQDEFVRCEFDWPPNPQKTDRPNVDEVYRLLDLVPDHLLPEAKRYLILLASRKDR